MAGAVGVVFGLCLLSFTGGALLMYVVMRRREPEEVAEAAPAAPEPVPEPTPLERTEQLELRWPSDFDATTIHRNPVVGLPEPEPVQENTTVLPEPAKSSESTGPAEPENGPLPDKSEFRQRYLETFEAARRRAAGH